MSLCILAHILKLCFKVVKHLLNEDLFVFLMRTLKEKLTQSFLLLKRTLETKVEPTKPDNAPFVQDVLKRLNEIAKSKEDQSMAIRNKEKDTREIQSIKEGIESLLKIAGRQEQAQKQQEAQRQQEVKKQEEIKRQQELQKK
ncbi:hypothetical protein NERG_01487, partial [Nematocida ausubeli]